MRIIDHPTIFFLGETRMLSSEDVRSAHIPDGVQVGANLMLKHFGVKSTTDMPWYGTAESDGDFITEVMGRLCYKSFMAGLNPNVEQVRSDNETFVGNVINSKHGSVTEHAMVNFVFADVTRVFTHELVRHRIGVAISQESLRYVRLTDLAVRFPHEELERQGLSEADIDCSRIEFHEAVEEAERRIASLTERWGFNGPEEMPFDKKKKLTSILRRLAPIGLCTNIGWSCTLRGLRNVIEQRTSRHAEEEIRWVFDRVARLISARNPAIFQDYTRTEINGAGEWTTPNTKV